MTKPREAKRAPMTENNSRYGAVGHGSTDAGGVRKRRGWPGLLAAWVAAVLVLGGCDLSPDSGEAGSPSPRAVAETARPSVTITDAYIEEDRPVVEFTIEGLDHPPPEEVEFTVARLVNKDDYKTWQSYHPTLPTGPRTGNYVRLQAGQVRGDHGNAQFVALGGGAYRYTFPVDVTETPVVYSSGGGADDDITESDWEDASGISLRRFVVLLRPGDGWAAAYDAMDVGTGAGAAKRSVATASCNNCHETLAAHGGNRIGVETCSNCHNQYSFSSHTGAPTAVDLAYLGHEIHSGGGLANQEQFLRERWTAVSFPRDIKSCGSCHDADVAGTANHAYERPTIEACGSCHDDVNFETGAGHSGGARANTQCAECHTVGSGTGGKGADVAHADPARDFAIENDLKYVIDSADLDGDTLTVAWRVESGGTDVVHGEEDWAFSTTLRVGWYDTDFSHSDPGSSRPGHPVEVSGVHAAAGTTESGGVYTTTVDLAGKGFSGGLNLVVSLGGNVANGDHSALVASNAFEYIGDPRRELVSVATCTNCHEERRGVFSKHGGNRHNDVRQCILCHNNNSTDWVRRSADGRAQPPVGSLDVEAPTNFMVMAHKIHSARDGYALPGFGAGAWSSWGDLRYPAGIANCTQCHIGDSYYPPAHNDAPRGTTVDSRAVVGIGAHAVNSHWKTTAAMSACSSCHDSAQALAHMKRNGGGSGNGWNQPTIDASAYESCASCHGPGREADVKRVHDIE